MKKNTQNSLLIAFLFFLIYALTACSVSKQFSCPKIEIWTVTDVCGNCFKAKHNKEKATFTTLTGDSIYIGKSINVSTGK